MTPLHVLAVVAVGFALYNGSVVFLPISVAFFLAVLLEPVVERLESLLGRGKAASLAVILFLCAAGLAGWGCYRPFASLAKDLPRFADQLRDKMKGAQRQAQKLQRSTQTLVPQTQSPQVPKVQVVEGPRTYAKLLLHGLGSVVAAASIAVFVPFLALFLLMEKGVLKQSFDRAASSYCDVSVLDRDIPRMIRAYFLGNFIVGSALAVIQSAVFMGFGLQNAVGIGVLTGFLNIVPILGLPVALILPLAQALIQFQDPAAPVLAIAGIVSALHLAVANYVIPRVVGSKVQVNSFGATAAMLLWGWLWGVVGFLLAIPLTALIKIALASNPKTAALSDLLASKPRPLRPLPRWPWRRSPPSVEAN